MQNTWPLVKAVSKTWKISSFCCFSVEPPAFMKETGVRRRRTPEKVLPGLRKLYCKVHHQYEKLGIPISWMTVQNEPLAVQTWDSCEYTAAEEKRFLRVICINQRKRPGVCKGISGIITKKTYEGMRYRR